MCVCVCVIYRILPRRTKALLGKMIQLTRNHQLLQRYILNYSIIKVGSYVKGGSDHYC